MQTLYWLIDGLEVMSFFSVMVMLFIAACAHWQHHRYLTEHYKEQLEALRQDNKELSNRLMRACGYLSKVENSKSRDVEAYNALCKELFVERREL